MSNVTVHAANFEFLSIQTGGIGARDQFKIHGKETDASMDFRDLSRLEAVTQDTYERVTSGIVAPIVGGFRWGKRQAFQKAVFGDGKNGVTFAAEWLDGKRMVATVPVDTYNMMWDAINQNEFFRADAQAFLASPDRPLGSLRVGSLKYLSPQAKSQPQDPSANLRFPDGSQSPSSWLWFGIFASPLIFGWFTLQRKYKKSARYIVLGWFVLMMVVTVWLRR